MILDGDTRIHDLHIALNGADALPQNVGAIILNVNSVLPTNRKQRLSVIVAYKRCKLGVRWHIAAVLEGSFKSPSLAVRLINAKLQRSESPTEPSEVFGYEFPRISQTEEGGRLAVAFISGQTLFPLLNRCSQDDLEWYKSMELVGEPQTHKLRVRSLGFYSSFLNRKHKSRRFPPISEPIPPEI
jgi:hypothetical protein